MMALSEPTQEQAEQIIRTVDSSQAFVATIMSPSMGARQAKLLSVEMVESFLEAHTIEDFQAVNLRLDIHYIDFGFLAQWLDEVIGDKELAAEIKAIHDTGEAFGFLVARVKESLRARLDQCDEVLNPEEEREVSVS